MKQQNWMPEEEGIDHTAGVIREGYMYIPNRIRSYQTPVFKTKILGADAICMSGQQATELFYDTEKFERSSAAPQRVLKTLFGKDGVQTLDGDEHRNRKEMFMSLMTKERLEKLRQLTTLRFEEKLNDWSYKKEIVLYEEMKKMLTRIACEWAGVPLYASELENRTNQLAKLFQDAASIGIGYQKSVKSRSSAEKWIRGLIEDVREGKLNPEDETALAVMSRHKNLNGELLETQTAAVDLLNILRPIVAISIFVNFTALAVYHYPEEAEKLYDGNEDKLQRFVQEVRRFYPFFPFIPAKVRHDFSWKQFEFKQGTLVLLDVYGTNHDPTHWDNPSLFKPDRFKEWEDSPFGFIPQGGGDYSFGHRCAGEWVTTEIMKVCLDFLANRMTFDVPKQDLSFSYVNMPSIPRSKVVLTNIRKK
ncbi:cytochrome P450 [Aciduricibacillus chroicocephali]|uniref:Cytochrome P450 n=1 Tax=Aciduricibacillus chroicocephali TaxID=3054939 RepID=A0ABY9KVQ0_9BACI|nr:cytochrome P450 [Bacillaceae bacterium 44XB]